MPAAGPLVEPAPGGFLKASQSAPAASSLPMLRSVSRWPRLVLIGLVRGYQLLLSPHLPDSCRFTPSCSQYAVQALREYGALKGFVLSVWRVVRCHPWGGSGYDPPRWFGEPPSAKAAAPPHDPASA